MADEADGVDGFVVFIVLVSPCCCCTGSVPPSDMDGSIGDSCCPAFFLTDTTGVSIVASGS
jgi:hypothetical protein